MDDATYQALKEKIGELTLQNKQLKRANTRQKKKIRYLRRTIAKLKEEQSKGKQYYRNGRKRGKHGMNG